MSNKSLWFQKIRS